MNTALPKALTVLVGLGFPRRIASLGDALAFLDEQTAFAGDEAYEATVGACREALEGRSTAQEAYDVLAAFARRFGILVEDSSPQQYRKIAA